LRAITFAALFKHAYKTIIRKDPELQSKVETVLKRLAEGAFEPSLQHTQT
jgi:mRNA-degrading endonuclease YafQ of YafQ-DinJ toxin-antitoxin module